MTCYSKFTSALTRKYIRIIARAQEEDASTMMRILANGQLSPPVLCKLARHRPCVGSFQTSGLLEYIVSVIALVLRVITFNQTRCYMFSLIANIIDDVLFYLRYNRWPVENVTKIPIIPAKMCGGDAYWTLTASWLVLNSVCGISGTRSA